jgi:hypothetical protein
MPPPGSGEQPWTHDKVNAFGCWIQQGCAEQFAASGDSVSRRRPHLRAPRWTVCAIARVDLSGSHSANSSVLIVSSLSYRIWDANGVVFLQNEAMRRRGHPLNIFGGKSLD